MTAASDPVRVLFVCLGNICRSPAAEGVFQHFVDEAGHGHNILLDSAGTIGYHTGDRADPRMREAAERRGYRLSSIARQITPEDIERYDLIVPMDHDNLIDVTDMAGGERPHIRLLGCFLEKGIDNDHASPVPDPYFGGRKGFDRVLDMIEQAAPGLLAHCLELHARK